MKTPVDLMNDTKVVHRPKAKYVAIDYLQAFGKLLNLVDMNAIERIARVLADAREANAMVYVAGNGGSAAMASHWVNDLGKATKCSGRPPMRMICLSDNVPWLTALANDEGYERVFSGQLENFASPGDVLVVISSSGNSANLVQAVELAQARRVLTIGLLGFDGGVLKQQVDDYLLLPTEKGAYGLVEPGHQLICHILTACLAKAVPVTANLEE
jgi:D-sedoheptulose 7-phosphate isomerase